MRDFTFSHRGDDYSEGSLLFDFYQVARQAVNPHIVIVIEMHKSRARLSRLSAAPRAFYTIVIKIIVDISAATVPAPPFCPNYFLTRPIKGAGPRRCGGCSSGSSRRHNRKTGRPSVIKTARVGVQTSLALSSLVFSISHFFLSLPLFLFLLLSEERRDSPILPSLEPVFVLERNG